MRKLMDSLDMTGNEIINVSMQKITSFPTDNLFTGRLIYLESESEETPSGYYYYNGEDWASIGSGGSTPTIDDTKINVMCDGDPKLYTFDTLADTKTFLNSNTLSKHVTIGNDANITSIGSSAFYNCTSLTSITIPNSVTSIGDRAFYGCTRLTNINIPSSVTSIDTYAFYICTSLVSINIPSSVTNIGGSTFSYCTSLTSITIPSSVTNIGGSTFSYCTSLTSITIPNSVKIIHDSAFYNCTSLTHITIPSSVTSIGSAVFKDCTSLTRINIPSGVTSIGGGAFQGCTSLTSINIPSSVTSIDSYAFSGCDIQALEPYKDRSGYPWGATNIYIQNEDVTTTIDSSSTDRQVPTAKAVYSKIDEITIDQNKINVIDDEITLHTFDTIADTKTYIISSIKPKSVIIGSNANITSIDSGAFSNCTSLTSITIPNSVTSIDSGAFYNCTSLTRINIPSGVTSIGSAVFKDCTSLTRINIPSGVTSIGGGAFQDCTSLTRINIPSGVTSIGGGAFQDCTSLTSINIPSSVTSIGGGAFQGCTSLTSVTINANTTNIKSGTFASCTALESVSIGSYITTIESQAFYDCTSLTSIYIPNNVTTISSNAFGNCTSLKSITINNTTNSINIAGSAFAGLNSLNSVTIKGNATLGSYVFAGCSNLKSVYIDNVTEIGNGMFSGCVNLSYISMKKATTISAAAFTGCSSLKSITIPNTVTSIDSTAFQNCDIMALEPYKTSTGYPWGATDIYIQNEDVTTTIDQNSTDRQVPTAKAIYNFIRPIFEIRYGFRINKNNSDPDTRVEYLYDAVGMTPAKMTYDETTHKGTFDYGSWGNVWFIKNNRPVKLNFNGTVEAELNPNNYWETVDGQDSELETSTNCNFMSEIPIVYVKRWEDENYNYVVVCDKQYDEDYLAYTNTDKDGNLKPLYAPMFKGYKDSNNILRSIAGVDPMNSTTTSNEVMYSNNINTSGSVTGWQIEDVAKHELISDLLTLISKNTDSQTVFGNGVCQTSTRVFTGYNEIVTNTKTVKSDCGQFCGYNDNVHHVNIFHIQDFWGNRFDRCLGLITSGGKYYYKMTPENGGYVYSETITDYTNNGYNIAQDYSSSDITPPASSYIKNQSTGIFGNLPNNTTGASDSTYYCDYYSYNSSGVRLLVLGGDYGNGRYCGSRYFSVRHAPSYADVDFGASPFYV